MHTRTWQIGGAPCGVGDVGAEVVETHCSTLFFVDDLVYKRKKPLDLGFADFRTPDARRSACEAEVALNRRLAPDVYLGVATVLGPDGEPCDSLVVMRRMPHDRSLTRLVLAGVDVRPALQRIALDLAALHARSPAPPHLAEGSGPQGLAALWNAGLDALRSFPQLVTPDTRERTRQLALRYVEGRGDLLEERITEGRVVDGHGDLLADDVYVLEDGPRLLDCLEFDERLRVGDGLLDAAFLAMDLERLGRADLGAGFLAAYRAAARDEAPGSLEHHFLAYRAHIRSKVACIRAAQTGVDEDGLAGRLAALSLDHLDAGRVRLITVGGAPGSGKTTVASGIGAALGAAVLSSDRVRKELCGIAPTSRAGAPVGTGIYAPAQTEATYSELASRARRALRTGTSVVVDATLTAGRHRAELRAVASDACADLTELRCVVDDARALSRMAARVGGPSDATPAVRAALLTQTDPWPEAHELDTTQDPARVLERALRMIRADRPDERGPGTP